MLNVTCADCVFYNQESYTGKGTCRIKTQDKISEYKLITKRYHAGCGHEPRRTETSLVINYGWPKVSQNDGCAKWILQYDFRTQSILEQQQIRDKNKYGE